MYALNGKNRFNKINCLPSHLRHRRCSHETAIAELHTALPIMSAVFLLANSANVIIVERSVDFVINRGDKDERKRAYAIKFPADGEQVLLPIDSKFPCEDYEHLQEAIATGDSKLAAHYRRELESKIKGYAKDISTRYINRRVPWISESCLFQPRTCTQKFCVNLGCSSSCSAATA